MAFKNILRYRVASILFALGCIYIYSIFTASSAIKSSDYHRSRRSTDELLLTDNMTHPDVDEHHENCSEPAYKEFPDDHMSEEVRHKGGILVHVLVVSKLSSLAALFGRGLSVGNTLVQTS